jgi:peroxiredoxin
MTSTSTTVKVGDLAPDFQLRAVDRDATVTLADYRGRSVLLLALFRGLYCPFCRRAISQMANARPKLEPLGVESLAVVATSLDNARLYFKYHASSVRLAVDPELTTHSSYGLPRPAVTQELLQTIQTVSINPTGELPRPLIVEEATKALDRLHGFGPTEQDHRDSEHQFPQFTGQFLIDRHGVIRWLNIEGATEGLSGIGRFPSDDELTAAVRALGQ